MNCAVGGNDPGFLCIDSPYYNIHVLQPAESGDAKVGNDRFIPVIIRSPEGVCTKCCSVAMAAKIMRKDVKWANMVINERGIYRYRDGWQIVRAEV